MGEFELGGGVVHPLHAVAALEEDTLHDSVTQVDLRVFPAEEEGTDVEADEQNEDDSGAHVS